MADDPDHIFEDADGFLPSTAPPAWGSEDDATRLGRLSRKARDLPPVPGVYLMKDHKGVVLYVGKASKLCDRVSSYFVPSADLGPKKQPMLGLIHDFEILICDEEWEAVLAESRLIKDVRPHYNTRQLDDKTYPYLVITRNEDYPRVMITRDPHGKSLSGDQPPDYMRNAKIYGPFTEPGALREAIQVLQQVFKYRTCKLDIVAGDRKNRFFRPCILHAIGQCTAPCADRIDPKAYREDIDRFTRFIGSKRSVMLRELRTEMEAFAEKLNFERAAQLRDQIRAIEKLSDRGTMGQQWQPEAEIGYIDPKAGLEALQKALGMERMPRCVEGIDIAHLMGSETVGSKVCFVDGRPFKEQYQRFRIRGATNDDYASIREVVSRRYREAAQGHELYPDIVLIDGGLGQLHAAQEALDGLTVQPPMMISLAKKEELIYVRERSEPIRLPRNNPGLRLCQAVRDEAHRFAQHYHHVLRKKRTLGK